MNDQREQTGRERAEREQAEGHDVDRGAESGAEGAAVQGGAGEGETGMTAEEAESLVDLARSGEVDVPVGAEDFVEALRLVAAQRDEHLSRFQRLGADYQNFQRRARQSERDTRELASVGVVQSLLQVLDFFDMALKQDPEKATAAQVIGGVQMIKAEFLRVLGSHGVGLIVPGAGDEFDPLRHEAIERLASGQTPEGRVLETRSPGYTMGDRVVRPAKVTVSAGVGEQDTGDQGAGGPAGAGEEG